MDWETHRKLLLKKPGFKELLAESELEYQVARAIIKVRLDKGLTQAQLAKRLKTKQSVISRAENAKTTPSLSFLKNLAKALDVSLRVDFK